LERFDSYVGPEGLVSQAPNYMFLDWVPVGPFSLHHPPASMGMGYMTAVLYRALLHAAELDESCGEGSGARPYRERACELRDAFVRLLWDPHRGLYRDGLPGITRVQPYKWLPADPKEPSFTAHTNVMVVACGIAESASARAVIERVIDDDSLPTMQPYFLHYFFEALARTGLFERYALGYVRSWRRLLDEHPGSLKEKWESGDYSHAWSATPTYQLSARVLGVTPAAPGFSEFHVRPRLGELEWARGTVPTARGPVVLSWRRNGAVLSGTMRAPVGCIARLQLPGAARIEVRAGRRSVLTTDRDDRSGAWTVEEGEYDIEAAFAARGTSGGMEGERQG
jgi:hypothetical protein